MNFKALLLGSVVGFVVAVAQSCGGGTTTCGPNNCTGCCNAGTCVTADKLTDSACGSSGNACSNCAASSQTCNMSTKSCIGGSSGTGGGTSGTGGGTSGTGGGTSGTGGGTSGTGGGSTAGGTSGTGGGSSMLMTCDFTNPACPAGTECLLNDLSGNTMGTCVPGGCSVVNQDCAGNSKCIVGPVPDGGLERQCTAFTLGDGGVAEGAACTPALPDPCQRGSQCIGASATSATCRRFCSILTGCGPGSECVSGIRFQTQAGPTKELHLVCSAVTACDPFTQAPCQTNEACQLYRAGAPPACLPAGTVMAGGTCSPQAPCARGFQCIISSPTSQTGNCRAFCNVDGGMPGCSGSMCNGLMGTAFGACQ